MKTIKGEKITEKEIRRVIRSLDVTAIYKLNFRLHGWVEARFVYDFVRQYAPNKFVCNQAIEALRAASHSVKRGEIDSAVIRRSGVYHGNDLIELVDYVKRQCAEAGSDYAKRPMLGKTHLYFCSPVFGHKDYNKFRSIPIAGNESLCELVINYADKYFAPIYGK